MEQVCLLSAGYTVRLKENHLFVGEVEYQSYQL